jgi:CBS-domain-containing membrane protein
LALYIHRKWYSQHFPACGRNDSLYGSGATGLDAAVHSNIVALSWRFLPTVLASSFIMLGWALIINNLGRRRYPVYWWAAGKTFVADKPLADEKERARE